MSDSVLSGAASPQSMDGTGLLSSLASGIGLADSSSAWASAGVGGQVPQMILPPPLEADSSTAIHPAGQDFDGDGQADLFFRDLATGEMALRLMNQGIAIREDVVLNPFIRDNNWRVAGSGNFDGDSFADLVWHNTATGQALLWLLNNGTPTEAVALPSETDRSWGIVGVGNFDGDQQADDLLWFNSQTGARRVWLMDGTSRSQIVDIEPQIAAPGELLGVGDFDRNGTSDLLWRGANGLLTVWEMTGTQLEQTVNLAPTQTDDWEILAIGDFDNPTGSSEPDGNVDILWHRPNAVQLEFQRDFWTMAGTNLVSQERFVGSFPEPDFDPSAGFDIQFDYRFDSAGWFTDERRAALEASADVWERVLQDDFEDTPVGTATPFVRNPETDAFVTTPGQNQDIFLIDQPIDDIVIFVGTQSLGAGGSLGRAGSSGFFNNETRYIGNDYEPWAGSLTFNRDSNWFFDSTPATDDDIPSNQSDFISTAVHEIGHILGFTDSVNAFAQFVNTSGDRFVGPNALAQTNGAGIPLEEEGSHIEDGFELGGSGETALDPISFTGRRQLPTILDLAIFDDIGYDVNYSQAAQNQSDPS